MEKERDKDKRWKMVRGEIVKKMRNKERDRERIGYKKRERNGEKEKGRNREREGVRERVKIRK